MVTRLNGAKEKARNSARWLVKDTGQEMMGARTRRVAMEKVRGDRTQDTF